MSDYLQPLPSLDAAETIAAFDEATLWSTRAAANLFRFLELNPSARGLDLGCGAGFPLLELAQLHGPGSRFWGADLWAAALRRAEAKRRTYGLDHVALARCDAGRLPFADASFDVLVSNVGLNNFEAPEAAAAEAARVAKPGAILALTTNLRGHYREFYAAVRAVLNDLGASADEIAAWDAQEAHRGTLESVARLLLPHGFDVVRNVQENQTIRYVDGSAFLRAWLTRMGFLSGWREALPAGRDAEVLAATEERLNAQAKRDGELRLTVPWLYLEARKRS